MIPDRVETEIQIRPELKIPCYGQCTSLSAHSEEDPLEYLHVFDIVRMENNWIETEGGVLAPKNGVLMITGDTHGVERAKYLKNVIGSQLTEQIGESKLDFSDIIRDITLIKPYRTFYSSRSNVANHLNALVAGTEEVEYASDPKSAYKAGIYDDSLVFAPGIDAIVLTQRLRPAYQDRRGQIIKFAERMLRQ